MSGEVRFFWDRWLEDGVLHIHEWPDQEITPFQAARRNATLVKRLASAIDGVTHFEGSAEGYGNLSVRVHCDLPPRDRVEARNTTDDVRAHFLAAIDGLKGAGAAMGV